MTRREMIFIGILAAGLACIVYGLGLAWSPAAWIAAGVSVIILAVLAMVEV